MSKIPKRTRRFDTRRLKRACKANEAKAAKEALLQWAAMTWPEDPPTSLGALALHTEDALSASINSLQQSLYGAKSMDWREGERLWRAFGSDKQASTPPDQDEHALEPLYKI